MTTKEANGLSVKTHFNKEKLKLAIIKKMTENGELDGRTLRQIFVDDLVETGFLKVETNHTLMELEREGILTSELKSIGRVEDKLVATRHYKLSLNNQEVRK